MNAGVRLALQPVGVSSPGPLAVRPRPRQLVRGRRKLFYREKWLVVLLDSLAVLLSTLVLLLPIGLHASIDDSATGGAMPLIRRAYWDGYDGELRPAAYSELGGWVNHQPLKRGQAGSIPALDEIKRGLDDPSFIWLEMTRGFRQKTYVLIEDAEVRLSGLWVPHPRQDLKPFRTVLVWYLEADPYIYDGQAMSIGQPLPVEEAPLLHFSRSCDVVYCSLRGDDCEVIAYAEKRAAVVSAKTNGLYSCMVPKVEDAPLSFFDKMVRHYRYDLRGWGHVLLGRTLFSAWLTCFYLVAIIAVTRFDRRFDGSAPMLLLGFLGMFSAARVVVFVACSADYPDSRHPGLISAQSALVGLLFLLSLTGRVRGSVRYWWRVARGSAVRFRYAFAEASWEIDRLAIAELDEADIVLPPMSLAYTFLTYDPESVQAHSLWLEPEAPRPYVLALPYSSANRGVPFFNLASDGILDGPMSEGESPMNSHEEMRRAGRKRRSRRKRRHKTQLSLVTTKEEGSPT